MHITINVEDEGSAAVEVQGVTRTGEPLIYGEADGAQDGGAALTFEEEPETGVRIRPPETEVPLEAEALDGGSAPDAAGEPEVEVGAAPAGMQGEAPAEPSETQPPEEVPDTYDAGAAPTVSIPKSPTAIGAPDLTVVE